MKADRHVHVHRLVATEEGPYRLNRADCTDVSEGNEIAAAWWNDEMTLSVVIMDRHREDARYVRPGIDPERIPEQWPKPEPKPMNRSAPQELLEAQAAPAPPPTLFNAGKRPPPPPQGVCECCALPKGPPDAGDTDPTPSGRIHNLLCPVCGQRAQVRHTGVIWRQYMDYQRRLSLEHSTKPKPWN